MPITVLLNRGSGALKVPGAEEFFEGIRAAFARAGVTAEVAAVEGAALPQRVAAALARTPRPEAIIVGGGDGTASAAGRALAGTDVPLGVIPLGTFNLFARALRLPLEPLQAVQALIGARPVQIDTLQVNGKTVLQHASIGLQPHVILLRERQPHATRLGKIGQGVRAWLKVLRRPPLFDITIETPEERLVRRTAGVLIANDPLREGPGEAPVSEDLRQGRVAVYVATSTSRAELARLTAAAALGLWRGSGLVEELVAREVAIASPRPQLLMSLDGELELLDTPLICHSVPRSLRVLVPAS